MEAEFLGDKRCPVCGKRFTVLWPHQWAYKRGKPNAKFYCSWKCLRSVDEPTKEWRHEPVKRTKVTLESKKKAVQIALDGGDPIRYLESLGVGDTTLMWYRIKKNLKETDPETYEKLPKRTERKDAKKEEASAENPDEPEAHTLAEAMTGMENAAAEFLNKCEEMGLKVNGKDEIRTPDKAVVGPFAITAIRHKIFGEFYHDVDHNCVDWRTLDGDEMSMKIPAWKNLVKELPEILKMLGVEM